jgi:hypothetical protein
MKRCPKCGFFDVEYDSSLGMERCLWRDCGWINVDHIDIDELRGQTHFKDFKKSLKPKVIIT